MEYKDIADVINYNQARIERIRNATINTSDSEEEIRIAKSVETVFCVAEFMRNHKDASYESLTNFSSDELDELTHIAERYNESGHRGRRCNISTKSELFLALMYFTTYLPLNTLSGIVSVKTTTLNRIIKRVVDNYFPSFIRKFIPRELPPLRVLFVNFPDAVGAVDSTIASRTSWQMIFGRILVYRLPILNIIKSASFTAVSTSGTTLGSSL